LSLARISHRLSGSRLVADIDIDDEIDLNSELIRAIRLDRDSGCPSNREWLLWQDGIHGFSEPTPDGRRDRLAMHRLSTAAFHCLGAWFICFPAPPHGNFNHMSRDVTSTSPTPQAGNRHFSNWGVYAAAAGAGLAMAANADAALIYTVENKTASIPPTANSTQARVAIDIAGKAFSLRVSRNSGTQGAAGFFNLPGSFKLGGTGFPKNYALGASIKVSHTETRTVLRGKGAGRVYGAWGPGTVTGFVGFKNASVLGWMRIVVDNNGSTGYPDAVKLIDYAYTALGGSIKAGQTSSSTTPEPGTAALGLLAAGAAGLVELRRRRKEFAGK
jgi:MYXO-CTERM domain-containing protein